MRSFEVTGLDAAEFAARVDAELETRELHDYVSVHLNGDRLYVRLRYFGTSELRFRVVSRADGFRAELDSERMATFHAPFRDRFSDRFERVLETLGARLV
jgi:hypothetical protein